MAFNLPNFLNAPMSPSPFASALQGALGGFKSADEHKKLAADTLRQQILNQFLPEHERADIDSTKSGTSLNLENVLKQHILNKYLPQREQQEIKEIGQRGDYYAQGGGKAGVAAQNQNMLQQHILRDNPNLTPDQAFEAAGNLVRGKTTLNDGTSFNVSGLTQLAAQKAVMQGNPSALVTQQVQASQGEAEIPVVDKFISEGVKPYAYTVNGVSPKLLWDSAHPNDVSAQTRLGKKAAADFLNFDRAAISAKVSGTQSGVTIITEMMDAAGQKINNDPLIKTEKSRQVALETVSKALREMLKARKSVGVLQGGLAGGNQFRIPDEKGIPKDIKSQLSEINYVNVPDGMVRVYKDGRPRLIQQNHLEAALRDGGKLNPG